MNASQEWSIEDFTGEPRDNIGVHMCEPRFQEYPQLVLAVSKNTPKQGLNDVSNQI